MKNTLVDIAIAAVRHHSKPHRTTGPTIQVKEEATVPTLDNWGRAKVISSIKKLIPDVAEQHTLAQLSPTAFSLGARRGEHNQPLTDMHVEEVNNLDSEDARSAYCAGFASMRSEPLEEGRKRLVEAAPLPQLYLLIADLLHTHRASASSTAELRGIDNSAVAIAAALEASDSAFVRRTFFTNIRHGARRARASLGALKDTAPSQEMVEDAIDAGLIYAGDPAMFATRAKQRPTSFDMEESADDRDLLDILDGPRKPVKPVPTGTPDPATLKAMSFPELVRMITRDWKNVNYAAKPYLSAMQSLQSINDQYMQDDGRSVVLYFLSNATSWRGPVAQAVKKELKARLANRR